MDTYRVIIKPSRIPRAGRGAYAAENIEKDVVLGEYKGVLTQRPNKDDPYACLPYKHNGYLFYLNETTMIDAADPSRSNWTRYINCARTADELNLKSVQIENRIFFITTRAISAGEELLFDYGPEFPYWSGPRPGV